ncbi:Uncharacterised protein [Actinomyces viscosus]|uniref:Uncharacterized protein n=1 Tax=Actinomyces viscosus TaxID=1656 RepID=A0A448PNQ0_ACTVI|nr:Uncharacterised protein [Actinomyces viscosus]
MRRVGEPPTFRQLVSPDSCVNNSVIPDDIRSLIDRKEISITSKVLRQRLRTIPFRNPLHDLGKILEKEAVEKIEVCNRIVSTTAGNSD